jgi:hypothetical protein
MCLKNLCQIPVSENSGENASNDNLVGQPEDIETDLDKVLTCF